MNARWKREREKLRAELQRSATQANDLLRERNDLTAQLTDTKRRLGTSEETLAGLRYQMARYDARTDTEDRLKAEIDRLTELLRLVLAAKAAP